MNDFLEKIVELIEREEYRISEHGYDELADDDLNVDEVIYGVDDADIIEAYPEYSKGPCVLLLQEDEDGKFIHVVWGIPAARDKPAVLVTAYRPDPERWDENFRRRSD